MTNITQFTAQCTNCNEENVHHVGEKKQHATQDIRFVTCLGCQHQSWFTQWQKYGQTWVFEG